jgi:hypothetical protein
LTPASLLFPNQAEDTASSAIKMTVKNTGSGTFTVSNIIIAGTNGGDFADTSTCARPIAPGGSCIVSLTFTPSGLGVRTGTLALTDNAQGGTQSVSLKGTGVAQVSWTPASLAFVAQVMGTTSAAKTVTLTNNMPTALDFGGINFTGADNGDFVETDTCGGSVPAKGKCKISVTFTPYGTGTRTATMNLNDIANNSPQTVSLSGIGGAQVTVSPTTLAFAAQKQGTTSPAKTVTLTNDLPIALSFSGVTFAGTDPSDFVETDTCGTSVPAKGKCTISVTFTPQAIGTRTATMNLNDSAWDSPETVSLTGTGK